MSGGAAAMRPFTAQIQAFLLVQAVNALVIDVPAVAANQHVDTPEAVSHPGAGDLVHARLKGCIEYFGLELLVPTGPALLTDMASPVHTHAVAFDQMADELLALRRP